jgi:hypothetical protein
MLKNAGQNLLLQPRSSPKTGGAQEQLTIDALLRMMQRMLFLKIR